MNYEIIHFKEISEKITRKNLSNEFITERECEKIEELLDNKVNYLYTKIPTIEYIKFSLKDIDPLLQIRHYFIISKYSDEWWVVYTSFDTLNTSHVFCDGFQGLTDYLKNKFV